MTGLRTRNLQDRRALLDLPARFWAKVDMDRPRVLSSACWVWTGADSGSVRGPYGVSWDGERRVKAHRWAWATANGPIPEGLQLDHLCRVTLCVRPSHLEPVTCGENIRRGNAPGPRAVRENTCKRGHEFTPANTRVRRDGGRECRACGRMHSRASKQRRRAARAAA